MALTNVQIAKVEEIFNEYAAMNDLAIAKMSECTDEQTMRIAEKDAERYNCAINALQRCMTACGCLSWVESKRGKPCWKIRNER